MERLVEELGSGNAMAAGASAGPQPVSWTCAHCTYSNSNAGPNCEMCSLPRA